MLVLVFLFLVVNSGTFPSYVSISTKEGEKVVNVGNENEIILLEEEHGVENVRRILKSPELQEFLISQDDLNPDNEYPTSFEIHRYNYEEVYENFRKLSNSHDHCNISIFGRSTGGKDMFSMTIFEPPFDPSKPGFLVASNIHGDEVVGAVMAVQIANFMCEKYGTGEENKEREIKVAELLKEINLFIIPTCNPDGMIETTRGNANGLDIVRNFPDPFKKPKRPRSQDLSFLKDPYIPKDEKEGILKIKNAQKEKLVKGGFTDFESETEALMKFHEGKNLILGVHYHGGAQVCTYGFDGTPDGMNYRGQKYSKSPDDLLLRSLCESYVNNNDYFTDPEFPYGISNGAWWYTLYGGIQDWEYRNHDMFSVTVELSVRKIVESRGSLTGLWNANFPSFLRFARLTYRMGIAGKVVLKDKGDKRIQYIFKDIEPSDFFFQNNQIMVKGIPHVSKFGGLNFRRLLVPGTYDILVNMNVAGLRRGSFNEDEVCVLILGELKGIKVSENQHHAKDVTVEVECVNDMKRASAVFEEYLPGGKSDYGVMIDAKYIKEDGSIDYDKLNSEDFETIDELDEDEEKNDENEGGDYGEYLEEIWLDQSKVVRVLIIIIAVILVWIAILAILIWVFCCIFVSLVLLLVFVVWAKVYRHMMEAHKSDKMNMDGIIYADLNTEDTSSEFVNEVNEGLGELIMEEEEDKTDVEKDII